MFEFGKAASKQEEPKKFGVPIKKAVDDFTSLDMPGDPGGIKVVEVSAYEKYISCFVTVHTALRVGQMSKLKIGFHNS